MSFVCKKDFGVGHDTQFENVCEIGFQIACERGDLDMVKGLMGWGKIGSNGIDWPILWGFDSAHDNKHYKIAKLLIVKFGLDKYLKDSIREFYDAYNDDSSESLPFDIKKF